MNPKLQKIAVTIHAPTGETGREELSCAELILREASLNGYMAMRIAIPPIEMVNNFLSRGGGDDGFISFTWNPFTLSDDEYEAVHRKLVGKLRPRSKRRH
jgi:hypothetical protein